MKTGTSNYTPKCLEFSKYFKGMQGVTTHQSEDIDYNDFSGTVYINRYEFLHRPNGRKRLYGVYKQPQRTRWGTMGVRVLQDIWQSLKESGCNRREKRIPKTD